jgi:hypothetical protein
MNNSTYSRVMACDTVNIIFSTQHRHAKTSRRVSPLHAVSSGEMLLPQLRSDDSYVVQFVGGRAVHFAFASTLTIGGRKWCDWVPGPASFGENH